MLVKTGDRIRCRGKLYEVIIADKRYFVIGRVKGGRVDMDVPSVYSNRGNILRLEDMYMELVSK